MFTHERSAMVYRFGLRWALLVIVFLIGSRSMPRAWGEAPGPTTMAATAPRPMKVSGTCRYKSPGSGMAFTEGLPLRVWADALDSQGYLGKTKRHEAGEVRFFVDGQLKAAVAPSPLGCNYFEATLTGLPVGDHVLTLESTNQVGIAKSPPITITVAAPAQHKRTIELKQDLVLDGPGTELVWNDATIQGNGFRVRTTPHWTGTVAIRNCLVTGLGSLTTPGIEIASEGGPVSIEDSVFEATGGVHLAVSGADAIDIRNNEFRSSNLLKFDPVDPGKSPIIRVSGKCTGAKRFQGNRIGTGIVLFHDMKGWLIGGSTDAESNILIGPRCVLTLERCQDFQIRGNYLNHDYTGGWGQAFNLNCVDGTCQNILVEHNVIRQGTWPIQGFAGELRYNLIMDAGENWVRSLGDGTKLHHNLFVHTGGGPVGTGIWLYRKEKNIAIYNNTFDGGAPALDDFKKPMIDLAGSSSLSSLRHNVFVGVAGGKQPLVWQHDPKASVLNADYNCFFNPQTPHVALYDPAFGGTFGAHDAKADPKFAQGAAIPYPIDQGAVWTRRCKVSEILAQYRQRYTPTAGSPLIGASDPADGTGSFIGAVGPGANSPQDLFGRYAAGAPKEQ